MENNKNGQKKNVYDIMTERIITLLEKGTIPWKQPWAEKEIPRNLVNKIPYRGINMVLLTALGYERNIFITKKQAEKIGASHNEGATPYPVVSWKWP